MSSEGTLGTSVLEYMLGIKANESSILIDHSHVIIITLTVMSILAGSATLLTLASFSMITLASSGRSWTYNHLGDSGMMLSNSAVLGKQSLSTSYFMSPSM